MAPHRRERIVKNRDRLLGKVTGPPNYNLKVKCILLAKMADK